ncbi:hypothetical protein ASG01_06285 [Chryseobacterium sp. Leaf180]|uniref:T9SS type B sorting domain-containing protein n=1 Tax=Chryseobacterium sp. Leaf180 TaxID=1736289 RepID=UPI0006F594C2|nr:T9SS type B sorting domain-containing protein [Chryseobacterium sp. Leaf180]KQR95449.1 hypothetical protein ASG01_06285 [Chryseobacterium sp. Leaf180]
MKKNLLFGFLLSLFSFTASVKAQTYQLAGNPVNTTGWDIVPAAVVNTDFIQLTADQTGQFGAIKLTNPINLKFCDKWKVEFDFRIDGNGTTAYGRGDGFTFWYLSNPPAGFTSGGGLGIPANANGLMVAYDIFNNSTEGQMSKVHILYGTNNTPAANPNVEYNNTPNSTFHSADLNPTQPFVGATYRHVVVNGMVDPANVNNWIITMTLDGTQIVNQSFAPSGGAIGMTTGYFGFSAATGGASARHSIKNVKVFIDKVPILQSTVTPFVCSNPSSGIGTINLTNFATQFVNNPANYIISYYILGSSTPIANPANFSFTGNTTITVVVKDPTSTLCDNGDGQIILNPTPFTATNATLTACNNNGVGVGIFNLDNATVSTVNPVTKQYYPTLAALNAGTSQITNFSAYPAANGSTVHVKVTTAQGCTSNAVITLNTFPVATVNEATLRACSIENNLSYGSFNLTNAAVTSVSGLTKKYYPSVTDAVNGTNEISTPNPYIAPNSVVYVKVIDTNGCYAIAKVNLVVIAPVYSTVLKDKTICVESKTTLDAGSGFTSYLWSTGATTQTISNVMVGNYSVQLKTGECTVTQLVKVLPSPQPVISSVDIQNTTVVVNASGGTPQYQYSMDNTTWQTSNTFLNISRGMHKVYLKDSYNCAPIVINITVPNIINVITPNGDGKNDHIDYSALSDKLDLTFTIFDRYGATLHVADKSNNYRWDGTANGRKAPTGNYWYTLTWTENNKNKTPVKFSGWIMVKNRE